MDRLVNQHLLSYILHEYDTLLLSADLEALKVTLAPSTQLVIFNIDASTRSNASAYAFNGEAVINFTVCLLVMNILNLNHITDSEIGVETLSTMLTSDDVLGLICHVLGYADSLSIPAHDKPALTAWLAEPTITNVPACLSTHLKARFGAMAHCNPIEHLIPIVSRMISTLIGPVVQDYEESTPDSRSKRAQNAEDVRFTVPVEIHENLLATFRSKVKAEMTASSTVFAHAYASTLPIFEAHSPRIILTTEGNIEDPVGRFIPLVRRFMYKMAVDSILIHTPQVVELPSMTRYLEVLTWMMTPVADVARALNLLGKVNWKGQGYPSTRVYARSFYAMAAYLWVHDNPALQNLIDSMMTRLGRNAREIIFTWTNLWTVEREEDKHVAQLFL